MKAELEFIGHIETPYKTLDDCPRNYDPSGPECTLVIDPQYEEALLGLEAGVEILVLYWFDRADRDLLRQSPRHVAGTKGTFALRSPHRPNPIGATVTKIESISGNQIAVRGLDCLDGTPLLDIKPAMKSG
jgi:tRNA-Thr(GGU) m(6)t(6)A37 methyltransferase TsaA